MAGKNKTVYIKDADAAVWQAAAAVPGKSLSDVIAVGLRLYLALHPPVPGECLAEVIAPSEGKTACEP